MKRYLLFSFIVLFTACAQKKEIAKKPITNLSDLFEIYWDERAQYYPLEATQQGDHRYNHLLVNDQTEMFRKKMRKFFRGYLSQLEKFKREELSENDKLSYDTFKYDLTMQIKGLQMTGWQIPFHQFWGLPLTMGQLGSGESFQPFQSVRDYDRWVGRMKDFTIWSNSAILNFREGMKTGVVLPAILVKRMISQMSELSVREPRKSLFYSPILKMPSHFSKEDRKRLSEVYIEIINKEINPTYKKLKTFLEKEYLPKARNTSGISYVKDGAELYKYLVQYWTTTNLSPEEIYQTGLKEVARIHLEMESIRRQVGFKGDLKSFFAYMREDRKFMPYKSSQEVLAAFDEIHKRMTPQLGRMFNHVPKTAFEIRQTEKFREAQASAEYSQGAPDGSRPGIFYVPIVDAKKFNTTSGMESLFLHEAIPGHHYQISLQQENEGLPKFRRFSWYGSYGEGWALYTESLGKELGLYTDPYQHMGALGDEMHRAIRLVVDVGLHLKNMTREEAIKYMMDHEAISYDGAVAEIERYMAIPGQALSYKIGALKISEMRSRYQKQMGKKFDLSEFHDQFLKDGCLPLAIVEKKLERWSKGEL